MKTRLFTVFVLIIGMALLVTWVTNVEGTKAANALPFTVPVANDNRIEFFSNYQDATRLGHTSEITFTVAFSTYLPAVLRNYVACSTIPTLLSPVNGGDLDTLIPLYRWDNGNDPNATSVRMQLARDVGFMQTVFWVEGHSYSKIYEFRDRNNLDPATTYYWRAWLMCGEVQGPYSEVWSFTTGSGGTILPAPVLTAPENGSVLTSLPVTVQWAAVSGAKEYGVYWRKAGQTGYSRVWINSTQFTFYQMGLVANTTYEWWVAARNDYAVGTASPSWQFTTPVQISSLEFKP